MIENRLLIPDRVRRPPREGFSWLDRRFLHEYASRLTGDAVFMYLFLAAVSDQDGLSFYRDATIAVRLRMREPEVVAARDVPNQTGTSTWESWLCQVEVPVCQEMSLAKMFARRHCRVTNGPASALLI